MAKTHYLPGFLAGLGTELAAVVWTARNLRRPFWIAWALLFLLSVPSVLFQPEGVLGWMMLGGQAVLVFCIGMMAIFSGTVARRLRRWEWVYPPHSPAVVPFVPSLITLLMFLPYLLAMAGLFLQVEQLAAALLPGDSKADTWLLALDNFCRCSLFLDFFEIFHFRFAARPDTWLGTTIVFATRFFMSFGFIRVAFSMLTAAYYRTQGYETSDDKITKIDRALRSGDLGELRYLCRGIGATMGETFEELRRRHEEGGEQAEVSYRLLIIMKTAAEPYFREQAYSLPQDDPRRTKLLEYANALHDAPDFEPPAKVKMPIRWLRLIGLFLIPGLLLLASLILLGVVSIPHVAFQDLIATIPYANVMGCGLAALAMVLSGWMLLSGRSWVAWLTARGILSHCSVPAFRFRLLGWCLISVTLLVFSTAATLDALQALSPGTLARGGTDAGDVTYGETAVMTCRNFILTEPFVDAYELFANVDGKHATQLAQTRWVGSVVVFAFRITLDVTIIALFGMLIQIWYNRAFRRLHVAPNTDLSLRTEALSETSHHDPLVKTTVAYHFSSISSFFQRRIVRYFHDPERIAALVQTSFCDGHVTEYLAGLPTDRIAALEAESVGGRLFADGELSLSALCDDSAIATFQKLLKEGHFQVRNDLAVAISNRAEIAFAQGNYSEAIHGNDEAIAIWRELLGENLARAVFNRAYTLFLQHDLPEAIRSYDEAIAIRRELVADGQHQFRNALAGTIVSRSVLATVEGSFMEAICGYDEAISIRRELLAEGQLQVRDGLAKAIMNRANAFKDQDNLSEAILGYSEAIAIYRELLDEEQLQFRDDLAWAIMDRAAAASARNDLTGAIHAYDEAITLWRELFSEGEFQVRNDLAAAIVKRAYVFSEQENLAEAIVGYDEAIKIFRELVGEGQLQMRNDLATAIASRARAFAQQRDLTEAIRGCDEAIAIRQELFDEGQVSVRDDLARLIMNRSIAVAQDGDLSEAIHGLDKAIAVWDTLKQEGALEDRRYLEQAKQLREQLTELENSDS